MSGDRERRDEWEKREGVACYDRREGCLGRRRRTAMDDTRRVDCLGRSRRTGMVPTGEWDETWVTRVGDREE